jgi:quercetin 2,3-dioxygenase
MKTRNISRRKLLFFTIPLTIMSSTFYWFYNSYRKKKQLEQAVIINSFPLDFQWQVQEPFLFCVHHDDRYPKGNKDFAPDPSLLKGRNIGSDFTPKDGFRMYHGNPVPGFPVHPHRGFETITIVRKGLIDHADSLGAAGRYGEGDVQWMTAGSGVQHSEMFPLLHQDKDNHVELFQIWLNLPAKNKMVNPDFKMLWAHKIPTIIENEGKVQISLICGQYKDKQYNDSPTKSWAHEAENEVHIMLVKLKAGGVFKLEQSKAKTNRTLYFFEGKQISLNQQRINSKTGVNLDSNNALEITTSDQVVEFLILQAKPINEPIVQYGPFVMNSRQEIEQAFNDYQRTQFGGWPWPRQDMVHGGKIQKFAKYPDGRTEEV